MRLTFFDLDQTLLEGDSDYEWGRFLVDEAVVDGPTYARANDTFKAQYDAGSAGYPCLSALCVAAAD